ncbi:hypothetical protein [Amycolatopsis albispora]|uniref:Uncharacterized protein n=1 Tax=Amycolatopsis albispora TaxID=1804986 RepID=A0A344L0T2_9PSEU|nr:hypothetical protein [Amycolatopsis albispora]AXB41656.1 hypothetical protein A4R43_03250 [Amycolatopsis albispora]
MTATAAGPRRLGYLELAARITDVAGLHLAPPARILALELGSRSDRPVLPMDPGTASLFAQLDAASRRPGPVHPAACLRFLTRLEHAVPPEGEVYLLCLAPPPVVRDWVAAHPRFTARRPGGEAHWADEVSQCLGHRGARTLRRRTRELEAGLRRWHHSRRDGAFTWVRAGH